MKKKKPKKRKRASRVDALLKRNKPKEPIRDDEVSDAPELPPKYKRLKPGPARFVAEYLKDQNATRAYIAAGYSPNGAGVSAHKLLKNANVRAAVERGLAKQHVELKITAKRIKKRIAEIAFATNYAKTSDILKACELLGKTRAMFTDKVVSSVNAKVESVDSAQVAEEVKKLEDEI